MTRQEAITFCESIECKYCPIFIYDLDKRSKHSKEILQIPCYWNLISHSDWWEEDDR